MSKSTRLRPPLRRRLSASSPVSEDPLVTIPSSLSETKEHLLPADAATSGEPAVEDSPRSGQLWTKEESSPRLFLIPDPVRGPSVKIVLKREKIAYFFTSNAVESARPLIEGGWTKEFSGKCHTVYVKLFSGKSFDTGRASVSEVGRYFGASFVRLNQSVLLNRSAATNLGLTGKKPFVEVEFSRLSTVDKLFVSRRERRAAKEAFELQARRKRASSIETELVAHVVPRTGS